MSYDRRQLAAVAVQLVFLALASSALGAFVTAESPGRMIVAALLVLFWGVMSVAAYEAGFGLE